MDVMLLMGCTMEPVPHTAFKAVWSKGDSVNKSLYKHH
jgi:hypothetical protein